jgi:hypothetical protein
MLLFAYDLLHRASRIHDPKELEAFYMSNRDKIAICSQRALINAKFGELKKELGVSEERRG